MDYVVVPFALQKQCDQFMQQHGAIGLIVIDDYPLFTTLRRNCAPDNIKEILTKLKKIAIEYNCALLISSSVEVGFRKAGGIKMSDTLIQNKPLIKAIADHIVLLYIKRTETGERLEITMTKDNKTQLNEVQIPL